MQRWLVFAQTVTFKVRNLIYYINPRCSYMKHILTRTQILCVNKHLSASLMYDVTIVYSYIYIYVYVYMLWSNISEVNEQHQLQYQHCINVYVVSTHMQCDTHKNTLSHIRQIYCCVVVTYCLCVTLYLPKWSKSCKWF